MATIQQLKDYQPTKATLVWGVVGSAVLTMIVGFTWGGWVTGGTAAEMAEKAAEQSAANLAAIVCVERFVNAPDAAAQLAALKETSSWKREGFVKDGKWATMAGLETPVDGAADLCADRLADMELPTGEVVDTSAGAASSVQ